MEQATDQTKATTAPPLLTPGVRLNLMLLAALIAFLGYAYWNSFIDLMSYWERPLWSHGWLVPVFGAVLLWIRWDPKALTEFNSVPSSERWWGVGVLAFGVFMRLVSAQVGIEVPDMLSFVPCLAGICLMVGGWPFLKWAGPIVLFLSFMFPLPDFMVTKVLHPLQKVATISSEYVLQTLGYGVERIGNKLEFGTPGNEVHLTVVEACSGLRMLTVFMSLSVAVALIIERPLWERIVVVIMASVPIAVASNIIRISTIGMIHYQWPDIPVPDIDTYAGLAMMPVGMLLLWLFVTVLSKVIIETDHPTAGSIDVFGGRGSSGGGGGSGGGGAGGRKPSGGGSSRSGSSRDKKSKRPPSPIRH